MLNKVTFITKEDGEEIMDVLYLKGNQETKQDLFNLGRKLATLIDKEIKISIFQEKTFKPEGIPRASSKFMAVKNYYSNLKETITAEARKLATQLMEKIKEGKGSNYTDKMEKEKERLIKLRNKVEKELNRKQEKLKAS